MVFGSCRLTKRHAIKIQQNETEVEGSNNPRSAIRMCESSRWKQAFGLNCTGVVAQAEGLRSILRPNSVGPFWAHTSIQNRNFHYYLIRRSILEGANIRMCFWVHSAYCEKREKMHYRLHPGRLKQMQKNDTSARLNLAMLSREALLALFPSPKKYFVVVIPPVVPATRLHRYWQPQTHQWKEEIWKTHLHAKTSKDQRTKIW